MHDSEPSALVGGHELASWAVVWAGSALRRTVAGRGELRRRLDLQVSVLQFPLAVWFQRHGADQPYDSSSHNMASFDWYVLLERGNLRARYGEGFRGGLI